VQGGSAEIELKKGDTIRLSTDKAFAEKGNKDVVFVDYVNITNVVKVGNRVFVDDGLISLVVTKIGKQAFRLISYTQPLPLRCSGKWIRLPKMEALTNKSNNYNKVFYIIVKFYNL